jgi:hypothetical protein
VEEGGEAPRDHVGEIAEVGVNAGTEAEAEAEVGALFALVGV